MHILILPSWYADLVNPSRGIFFKDQAEALAKQNVKVGVLHVSTYSLRAKLNPLNVYGLNIEKTNGVVTFRFHTFNVPKLTQLTNLIRLIALQYLFWKYVGIHGKPELIHLHSNSRVFGRFVMFQKKRYGIPYVVTEHFSGYALDQSPRRELEFARRVFKASERNFAVSRTFSNLLTALFSSPFTYLPNLVDTTFFKPPKTNEKRDYFTFVNIASMKKNKNQEMLINAFYSTFGNESCIKLLVIGEGPELNNLKSLVKSKGINNNITFCGAKDRNEILGILQKTDRLVVSSHYETFGIVLIEAMSCGVPVVSTQCGGSESIIRDDQLGELCEIDQEALARGLRNSYEKLYDSRYIRRFVIKEFSADKISLELVNHYKEILQN